MIVVSGWLRVEPSDRDAYLAGSRAVIETARTTPGCVDFSLSADLVDADRINIFEQWDSVEAVERFRGQARPTTSRPSSPVRMWCNRP